MNSTKLFIPNLFRPNAFELKQIIIRLNIQLKQIYLGSSYYKRPKKIKISLQLSCQIYFVPRPFEFEKAIIRLNIQLKTKNWEKFTRRNLEKTEIFSQGIKSKVLNRLGCMKSVRGDL